MKKYEAPVVELTKFDIEDVITVSIDNSTLVGNETAIQSAVDDIKNVSGNTSAYNGGIFTW